MTVINQFSESSITIGNRQLPAFDWKVELGSYGQLSSATVRTSTKLLKDQGINLAYLNSLGPRIPVSISVNRRKIFGGTYRHGFYTFHEDEVEFFIRDYAAILFDTKRSLAEINYQGVRVSDLIINLVSEYGEVKNGLIGYQINIKNDPLVGTIFDQTGLVTAAGGSSMSTYPRPIWDLMVVLAKWVGAQIYTTPAGVLIFEDIPVNPTVLDYTWKAPISGQNNPIKCLDIMHQPENNKNFTVQVVSYNQKQAQVVTQLSTVIQEQIDIDGGDPVRPKIYSGTAGLSIRSLLSSKGLGIPTYIFHVDGLTPGGAQSRADAVASEYAKRLYVATTTVTGDPNIRPGDKLQIHEAEPGSLLGFADKPFYVSGLNHSFSVPQGEGLGHTGFLTVMKSLTLPPASSDDGGLN